MPGVIATCRNFSDKWGLPNQVADVSPEIMIGDDTELDKVLVDSLRNLSLAVNKSSRTLEEADNQMRSVLDGEVLTALTKR